MQELELRLIWSVGTLWGPVGIVGMPDVVGRGLASIHDVTVTVAAAEGLKIGSVLSNNYIDVLTWNGPAGHQQEHRFAVCLLQHRQ
jgi:hypothetical protein